MARKRRVGGKRRHGGRKHNPNARRHQTTRAGRRSERDLGTPPLREKKRATTGREDVAMTPAGVLYGHGHLDSAQLRARFCHPAPAAVSPRDRVRADGGRLVASHRRCGIAKQHLHPAADRRPGRPAPSGGGLPASLDSRDLVLDLAAEGSLPPICIRVAEHRLTPRYEVQLELLRRASTAPRRHDPGWTPAELGGFTRRC